MVVVGLVGRTGRGRGLQAKCLCDFVKVRAGACGATPASPWALTGVTLLHAGRGAGRPGKETHWGSSACLFTVEGTERLGPYKGPVICGSRSCAGRWKGRYGARSSPPSSSPSSATPPGRETASNTAPIAGTTAPPLGRHAYSMHFLHSRVAHCTARRKSDINCSLAEAVPHAGHANVPVRPVPRHPNAALFRRG